MSSRRDNVAVIHRTVSPTSAFELEKTFCFRVGGVPWRRVLEGTKKSHRLDNWDSSAALAAFRAAKRRFWAERNGLRPAGRPPGPDLYTNEVDWGAGGAVDERLMMELDEVTVDSDEDEEEDDDCRTRRTRRRRTCDPPAWAAVEMGRIEPTGWDVDDDYFRVRTLEGMVVGD